MKKNQNKAPLLEALKEYLENRTVKFDVPGHKGGRGNPELTDFLGLNAMRADVNAMKPLDNLCHPVSVIKEAQELAAEAFGAAHAFFVVGGTTGSVQAMIMSVVKRGEKLIMPRNVHRSALNAVLLAGAIPVYVNPGIDPHLGIPLGMSVEDVKEAVLKNPDAKAVLVNNPTYYGVCADIKKICELAHSNNMLFIADEAHGSHFYFRDDLFRAACAEGQEEPDLAERRCRNRKDFRADEADDFRCKISSEKSHNLPLNAISAGADLSAVSMHKTGGSLTQSSLLLCGKGVNADYIRQIINLTQTTSGSYLLMSSLDAARKNLALKGKRIFAETLLLADYAREEINKIDGFYAFSSERIDGSAFYDFDRTKLSVHTRDIGLAGIEVYDILRDEYNIQIEFGDLGNILAIISAGDRRLEIERLVSALSEIKRIYAKDPAGMIENEYISPIVDLTPAEAFFSDKVSVALQESRNRICAEFVMCYPPGIPIIAPGERVTQDVINYIAYAKEKGCNVTGTEDINVDNLKVIGN